MLKAVEQLVNRRKDKVGNHRRVVFDYDNERRYNVVAYYYHETPICIINREKKRVFFQNGGWNTSSTTRAINSYKECYVGQYGYTVVDSANEVYALANLIVH